MVATQAGVELTSETYHLDSETLRFEYDQDTTLPSMAVVAALSEVVDGDPVELEPLHDVVDTDALDAFVGVRDTTDGDRSVTFTVAEYAVTVDSDGSVAVAPSGRDPTDDRNGRGLHR